MQRESHNCNTGDQHDTGLLSVALLASFTYRTKDIMLMQTQFLELKQLELD